MATAQPFKPPAPAAKRRKLAGKRRATVATKDYVRKAIAQVVDKKYITKSIGGVTAYDATLLTDMTTLSQGTADTNRVGDEVHLRSISWSWRANGHATVSVGFRIVIFQWKRQNPPTPEDVISAPGTAPTSTTWALSQYNHDQRKNFSVLYDETLVIGSANSGWQSILQGKGIYNIGLNAKRKLVNANCQFVAGGTTGYNHIYAMVIGANTSASGNGAQFDMRCKTNFNG